MKIIVDADACPVKGIIEEMAAGAGLELIMVSNYHHMIRSNYARVVIVDGSSQSADITIANLTQKGDIIVTQDYGLAALVLAKNAHCIHPQGQIYSLDNIDGLLSQRYVHQKARQAGKRITNPRKRQAQDDIRFKKNLGRLMVEANNN
ncbi:Protein of unknown function UPF0178 [Syntrophomonas zehnderi OL-4]|uniref:UPF0178 protein 1650 n=1 Tax=Syntrophomonas zehnderi OL-4 TaxID=690567 RepID=A0A0E4C8V0_9FIRM|nr:YaiI/YqxD family protein [Syntrophomonas zehnderi]CFX69116.1 Protein of unknown function UPF0178 [Syntrophomonas zehnderi OL-4]